MFTVRGHLFTTRRPWQPTNTCYKAANIENEYSGAELASNLMTDPKSVSSDSARSSGRWANRPPAAKTGQTSVNSWLDPREYPPNIQPKINFTPVQWVSCCSLWIEWRGFQPLNLNSDFQIAVMTVIIDFLRYGVVLSLCATSICHLPVILYLQKSRLFCSCSSSAENPAAECI